MLKLNFNKIIYTLLIGFLFITNVYAEDYVINSYYINVNVNENYSLDVEEKITANFRIYKHGIYRDIPTSGTLIRQDGTSSNFRARIKNIKVNEEFETSSQSNGIRIKIGDPDKTIIGEKQYIINYTYYMGKDQLDNFDEFYFNLIGNDWTTTIDNLKFNIIMPKDFDNSKLGFSKGKYGTANANDIEFTVDGKTIVGSVNHLDAGEALTVRCELPDNYFTFETNSYLNFLYLIPFVILLLSSFLWKKYGEDDIIVEQIEFYPPKGLNSLDVAFNYNNGKVNSKDVVSLLIYLANSGYLSIKESTSGKIFKKKGFTLTKLKKYEGSNEQEKMFFDGIFKDKDTVTDEDLKYKFYETMHRIINNKSRRKNIDEIFEKKASKYTKIIGLLLIVGIIIVCLKPFINNFYVGSGPIIIGSMAIYLVCLLVPYSIISNMHDKNVLKGIVVIIFAAIFIIASYVFLKDILLIDSLSIIGYAFASICLAGVTFFLGIMPKRTQYGTEILGKIKGFKLFLETCEKEKLEMLVEKDPSYFYNILPFTYVLGISDKWIKMFEGIALEPPEWYDSSTYDYYRFTHFMDDTMNTANSVMATPEPSGSDSFGGGGFTGGGFSGGGFGGGGGGSW